MVALSRDGFQADDHQVQGVRQRFGERLDAPAAAHRQPVVGEQVTEEPRECRNEERTTERLARRQLQHEREQRGSETEENPRPDEQRDGAATRNPAEDSFWARGRFGPLSANSPTAATARRGAAARCCAPTSTVVGVAAGATATTVRSRRATGDSLVITEYPANTTPATTRKTAAVTRSSMGAASHPMCTMRWIMKCPRTTLTAEYSSRCMTRLRFDHWCEVARVEKVHEQREHTGRALNTRPEKRPCAVITWASRSSLKRSRMV